MATLISFTEPSIKKLGSLNLVFTNLELKDRKLDFMLRPPFDAFVKCTEIEEWLAVVDDFRTKSEVRIVINQHPYNTFV